MIFEGTLWYLVKLNPTLQNKQYVKQLEHYGFSVGERFIGDIFHKWHWNRKKPIQRQIQKYSISNIMHYLQHITGILLVP